MSLNAATIAVLLAKGLSGVDILDVARAMEVTTDSTSAERQARYRERRKLQQSDWDALRGRVFERDGFECQYCGAKENLHCDHVLPLIQGGANDIENLTTACRSCNCAKSGRTPEEWLA
jgi:5-methylcytosine-specific restriction endonuclease McrA